MISMLWKSLFQIKMVSWHQPRLSFRILPLFLSFPLHPPILFHFIYLISILTYCHEQFSLWKHVKNVILQICSFFCVTKKIRKMLPNLTSSFIHVQYEYTVLLQHILERNCVLFFFIHLLGLNGISKQSISWTKRGVTMKNIFDPVNLPHLSLKKSFQILLSTWGIHGRSRWQHFECSASKLTRNPIRRYWCHNHGFYQRVLARYYFGGMMSK